MAVRKRRVAGVVLLLLVGFVGFFVWRFMRTEVVTLDEHAFVLLGGGGNSLVLTDPAGALVVDTKFSWPAKELARKVQDATHAPVKMVIDTHFHIDHTHGNFRFPGAEFVGHPKARERLLATDAMFQPGGDAEKMVPTTLVDGGKQFQFGDDYVDVRWLGRGHTDGDVAVFLHKRSLLHTGDLFVNGFYPVVDAKGGGSFRELGVAMRRLLDIGAKKIIPGHGPIATNAELENSFRYVDALWKHVEAGVRAGRSKEEIEKGFDPSPYHLANMMGGFTSYGQNVSIAYDEAVALVAAEKK